MGLIYILQLFAENFYFFTCFKCVHNCFLKHLIKAALKSLLGKSDINICHVYGWIIKFKKTLFSSYNMLGTSLTCYMYWLIPRAALWSRYYYYYHFPGKTNFPLQFPVSDLFWSRLERKTITTQISKMEHIIILINSYPKKCYIGSNSINK